MTSSTTKVSNKTKTCSNSTPLTLHIPDEFVYVLAPCGMTPEQALNGFIADVADLWREPWYTHGSRARRLAAVYLDLVDIYRHPLDGPMND